MIVWIASYPRSGNTLVRMMLKHCFDVDSYESKPVGVAQGSTRQISGAAILAEAIGQEEWSGDAREFHEKDAVGPSPVCVKTHLPPEDDQPCIYVVRNGRQAILSYYRRSRKSFPAEERTVLELILGCDFYRDWSTHFRAWDPFSRPNTLLLRYEVLVENPECEIDRIRRFIRSQHAAKPWRNPFSRLRDLDTGFFQRGRTVWAPDGLWTCHMERIFWAAHGGLMDRLGYPALNAEKDFIRDPEADYRGLITSVRSLAARVMYERDVLEIAANERLFALRTLTAEKNRLRAERGVRMKALGAEQREIAVRDAANAGLTEAHGPKAAAS